MKIIFNSEKRKKEMRVMSFPFIFKVHHEMMAKWNKSIMRFWYKKSTFTLLIFADGFFFVFHRFVIICELYENYCKKMYSSYPLANGAIYTKKNTPINYYSRESQTSWRKITLHSYQSRLFPEKSRKNFSVELLFILLLCLSLTPYSFSHTSRKPTCTFFQSLSLFQCVCRE